MLSPSFFASSPGEDTFITSENIVGLDSQLEVFKLWTCHCHAEIPRKCQLQVYVCTVQHRLLHLYGKGLMFSNKYEHASRSELDKKNF